VCTNNFHGRTITIVGFSSEEKSREGFGPFTPGFKTIPFGNAEALAETLTPNMVGFLVEPIQGEAGVNPLACAVARTALKVIIEENMIENAAKTGDYFLSRLKEIESP
jgi:acetylornithine/succinyldiaminopimelate/putrescine aminotransferase